MVVDASVLLSILFHEPGAEEAVRTLSGERHLTIAAPTLLEAEIVYGSRRGFGSGNVAELVERLGIEVRPFTAEHAREARLAYARFGKGRGHPARLNFGDCISYAVAVSEGRPLAYHADDFLHTDVDARRFG